MIIKWSEYKTERLLQLHKELSDLKPSWKWDEDPGVKEFRKLAVFISILGILQLSYQLFEFLKHEFWQFNNLENYLLSIDLYEFETFFKEFIKLSD